MHKGFAELVALVGFPTYQRGMAYAEEGRAYLYTANSVSNPEDHRLTWTWTFLTGSCDGSHGACYSTEVTFALAKTGVITRMEASCSCPVRGNCKHAVALLVTHLREKKHVTSTSPQWHAALGEIFEHPAPYKELALVFNFSEPDNPREREKRNRERLEHVASGMANMGEVGSLTIRPMSQGRHTPWVANDASWQHLEYHRIEGADPVHMDALDRIRQLHDATSRYYTRGEWIHLTAVDDPALWLALREAERTGVTFVEKSDFSPVLLEKEFARADIEVDDEAAGGISMRARLTHPALEEGVSVVRIGRPFHGIAWRDRGDDNGEGDADASGAGQQPKRSAGRLHLAQLEQPVSTPWLKLASMPEGITVPAEERVAFERDILPLISRVGWVPAHLEYTPTAAKESLHLGVGLVPREALPDAPRALISWSWGVDIEHVAALLAAYAEEAGATRSRRLEDFVSHDDTLSEFVRSIAQSKKKHPLTLNSDLLRPRHREHRRHLEAEDEYLASIVKVVSELSDLVSRDPRTGKEGLRKESLLRGLDVVTLLEDLCPRLAALGVHIDVLGEIPDFRQASAPVVEVGTRTHSGASQDWFDLDVRMVVGEHSIEMPVLLKALVEGEEAVFLESGQYVRLDTPELMRLRELLIEARMLNDRPRSGIRVPRVRRTWWEELLSLGIVQSNAHAWLDAVRETVRNPPTPAPIPSGLTATLRPYQAEGFRWLANLRRAGLGGVLADDMGLGKTVQTLAMIEDEVENPVVRDETRRADSGEETSQAEEHTPGPWIVVAPTSVVSNWKKEAEKFTPGLTVRTVEATRKRRGKRLAEYAHGADVLVTSYTLLRLESAEYAELAPRAVVLDEAQQAKNPASKTFTSIMSLGAPTFAITGTPIENNLGELWAIFALTAPGLLGSAKQFGEHTRRPIERGDHDSAQRLALLRRRIAPFLLRRTKADVALDLPEKQEQLLSVELEGGHKRLYEKYLQRERQRVLRLAEDMEHNRIEVLSALTRLRQLAIDPRLVDEGSTAPSSKLNALIPLLQSAQIEGHRMLVFSQFTRYLKMIAARLETEGIAYSYLDGATTNRAGVISGFASGSDSVFLISLKAGGVGLNLTMADYVVLTDPWWNPAVEEQAVDRTHRIGQKKSVHVYRMVSLGTIEEKVVALQDAKRQLVAGIFAQGESEEGAGGDAVDTGGVASGDEVGQSTHVGGAKLTAEDLQMLLG